MGTRVATIFNACAFMTNFNVTRWSCKFLYNLQALN